MDHPAAESAVSLACAGCATPLSMRDVTCPACGRRAPRPAGLVEETGRRVLLGAGAAAQPTDLGRPDPSALRIWTGARRGGGRPRADKGPAASGTVTDVDEREIAAVGGRQRTHAVVAGGVAVAVVVALQVFGGAQRWSETVLLLPTLAATAALAIIPFVIPRGRARTKAVRFHLTAVSGTVTECALVGAQTGAPLRSGDVVEVFGRTGPVVRADEIVRGNERLTGRPSATYLLAHHSATVALALAVVACVIALVVAL